MNLTPRGKSALLRPRYACRSPLSHSPPKPAVPAEKKGMAAGEVKQRISALSGRIRAVRKDVVLAFHGSFSLSLWPGCHHWLV